MIKSLDVFNTHHESWDCCSKINKPLLLISRLTDRVETHPTSSVPWKHRAKCSYASPMPGRTLRCMHHSLQLMWEHKMSALELNCTTRAYEFYPFRWLKTFELKYSKIIHLRSLVLEINVEIHNPRHPILYHRFMLHTCNMVDLSLTRAFLH